MQTELGMSELGGCEKRAKFRLLGVEPTDPSGSIQAVLGTLIHEAIAGVLKQLQDEGLISAEDLIEHAVEFAGVPGHNDHYEADTETLVDTKTTSQRMLDYWREHGISRSWRFQTATYAAALVKQGNPVRWIRIDVLARDTGDEESFVRMFDPGEVGQAMEWLAWVRNTPLESLPRAYAPDSKLCERCPFRRACWGEAKPGRDPRSVVFAELPNAVDWVEQLQQGRAMAKEGQELADEAKGVLDAVRLNERGTDYADVGLPSGKVLSWQVSERESLDMDAIEQVFAELGRPVSKKTSPSVTLRVVNKPKPKKSKKRKTEVAS